MAVRASQSPSVWDDFHARHRRQNFTPTFNAFLEAQIADADQPLEVRSIAWLLRRSWGNHSDSPVNEQGLGQTQADCARELKLDRRAVHPVFSSFSKRGYIRLEGRLIVVADDPRGIFAKSSANVGPFPTFDEEKEKSTDSLPGGFSYFLKHVWGHTHPDKFQELQTLERRHKEIRTEILTEWKSYRQAQDPQSAEVSERVGQNGNGTCPKGSDNLSERVRQPVRKGPTNGDRILITENRKQKELASSSSEALGVRLQNAIRASGFTVRVPGQAAETSPTVATLVRIEKPLHRLRVEQQDAALESFERQLKAAALRRENKPRDWGFAVTVMDDAATTVRNQAKHPPSAKETVPRKPPQPEPKATAEEGIRILESWLKEHPDSPARDSIRRQLTELRGQQTKTAAGS